MTTLLQGGIITGEDSVISITDSEFSVLTKRKIVIRIISRITDIVFSFLSPGVEPTILGSLVGIANR